MNNNIDCRGLKCPEPVIKTKKYFDERAEGEAVVIVDNEVAKNNIVKLSESNGFKNEVTEAEGLFHIRIIKSECECKPVKFENEKLTIVVSSDKLGVGDEKLGIALMKSYMFALAESDIIPENMLFLNGGVKLTVQGSEVLESLNKLKNRGVSIASCGTCLDFYDVKNKLAIGEISNMYTIIEKMNAADKTIKL
jgi:selenium metabolism protein YedF